MAITTRANVKLYGKIIDSGSDDVIDFLIPLVESDFLFIRNRDFDEDSEGIIYPEGSELAAIQMVLFLLSDAQRTSSGYKSESLGSYSYSRDTLINGYPESIVKRIARYAKAK